MRNLFDIQGKVVVITGATGVLCGCIAEYLAEQGARVVALGRNKEKGAQIEARIRSVGEGMFLPCDVMSEQDLVRVREAVLQQYGTIDVLINGAGGNVGGATISPDKSFLDIQDDAFRQVVDLNLMGTILPTRVLGSVLCERKQGAIVNFCSEAALRPLTRVFGYGCAKSAIANYTKFMATEMAQKYSPNIRVNAIVPGFLIGEQNRSLLLNEDGSYTERGKQIIAHTPAGRFSVPEELCGTIHYLISDASSFVTGALSIVDGGFDSFSI